MTTLKLYFKLLREGMAREDHGKDDIYQGGRLLPARSRGERAVLQRSQDPADRPSAAELLREIDRLGIPPPVSAASSLRCSAKFTKEYPSGCPQEGGHGACPYVRTIPAALDLRIASGRFRAVRWIK